MLVDCQDPSSPMRSRALRRAAGLAGPVGRAASVASPELNELGAANQCRETLLQERAWRSVALLLGPSTPVPAGEPPSEASTLGRPAKPEDPPTTEPPGVLLSDPPMSEPPEVPLRDPPMVRQPGAPQSNQPMLALQEALLLGQASLEPLEATLSELPTLGQPGVPLSDPPTLGQAVRGAGPPLLGLGPLMRRAEPPGMPRILMQPWRGGGQKRPVSPK